ncbi:hypothetical protein BDZ88DRAFT_205250 [Geranomyces variabilis]|nr:hypothetical protein BDZ88DRAFT_205250 [Geranomyces variabilis]
MIPLILIIAWEQSGASSLFGRPVGLPTSANKAQLSAHSALALVPLIYPFQSFAWQNVKRSAGRILPCCVECHCPRGTSVGSQIIWRQIESHFRISKSLTS